MLICHCNIITARDIEAVVLEMLHADPWQLIVPAKVYHAMQKRGRCCSCFPNVVDIIVQTTEEFHRHALDTGEAVTHLDRVRELNSQYGSKRHEGRRTDHRAA